MKRLFEKLGGVLPGDRPDSGRSTAAAIRSADSGPTSAVDSVAGLGGIIDSDVDLRAAVILTDVDGRIFECNSNVEAVIGFGRDDLIGRLTTSFTVESAHWTERRPQILKILASGEDWRGEVEMLHKDGSELLVRLHMSAIRGADGTPLGTMSAFVDISAAQLSLQVLQRNTEIFSQVREGIVLNAADGTLLDCNEEAARQIGFDREEMIGTAPGFFTDDPDAYGQRHDEIMALLQANNAWSDVVAFRHKNGSIRLLDIRLSPLMNSKDEYHGSVCFSTDVTEQRLAEAARSRGEEMLKTAQRIAGLGSWDWDLVTETRVWSDEMCRIYGFEPQPAGTTYKPFLEAIHPSDRSAVEKGIRAAIEHGVPYHIVYRINRSEGDLRYVEEQIEVVRDENDMPVRMSGTVQDVTARRVAEMELQESQRQLAEAQAIAKIGHFTYMAGAERTEWSPEVRRIFGLAEGELVPTYEEFLDMVHSADRPRVIAGAEAVLADTSPHVSDFRVVVGRTVKQIQIRQRAEKNADGELSAVFGTFQDITDAKSAEAALENNKALLERAQSIAKIGHWEFWADMSRPAEWSDESRRILGVGPDDPTPSLEGFLAVVHEGDRERVGGIIEDMINGEEIPAFGFRAVVDGEIKYIDCRNFLDRDDTGTVRSIFGTLQDVTGQRLIEIELTKKEDMLADAQALANMGHWEFNVALDEGYWSDSIYPMLGYVKGEIKPSAEAFRPLLHPDDRDWFLIYEQELPEKGVQPVLDFRIIRNGETRYIQMLSHEDRDESGNLRRIYGTTQDVTELRAAEDNMRKMNANLEMRVKMRTAELTAEVSERTKAEEQLRAQKELSEQLINVADVGIVLLDNDGKIQRMNQYLEEVTGYQIDEILGEDWFETMLPDFERSRVRSVFSDALKGAGRAGTINAIRAKSGKLHYMEWSDAPLTGPEGETIGLLAIGQDVTQRLRDQAQIFELSRRNEQILEAAGEGIYGVDLDGYCTFINNAGCEMLKLKADDIVGKNAHEALHHTRADGRHYEESDCPVYAASNEGIVQTISNEVFWQADGNKIPVEYTSTPIIEDGRITGAVVVFRDISDAQLLQQQVIQTSKLATLGEMATGVAHEINQPLNVIRMAVNNVRKRLGKGNIDPKYIDEKLERIDAQTRRAADIIDHMRVFGRKSDTIPVPIDPVATTEAALVLVSQQLKLADIVLETDFAPDCGLVMGHQVQLEQVMLNLVGNARHQLELDDKKKRDGSGRIRLIARAVPAAEPKSVELSVADNAGGIPGDVLPRIFEPFFTTKGIGEGTGLGLSISYGIVGDMGGSIVAHNEGEGPERGAVFTITLPLAKERVR